MRAPSSVGVDGVAVTRSGPSYGQVAGAGFAIIAVTFGLARYSYGLFLPDVEEEFGLTKSWLGLIASGSYAGYIVSTVVSLQISGVVGPRAPIVVGGCIAILGMALVGLSSTPVVLAIGVVLAGASPGFVFAPISDAVVRAVERERQNRAWTVINSGNGMGILIAGLVALGLGLNWRWAWLAFAGLALVAVFWNAAVMPSGRDHRNGGRLPRLRPRWFLKGESYPLFACSFLVGVVTTIYWTFATSVIDGSQAVSFFANTIGGGLGNGDLRIVFWTILGMAGVLGACAGDLISRFGLRRTLQLTCIAMGMSVGLLASLPDSPLALIASALVFGATFILVTGEIGIWSVHVFFSRPSAGFGATFLIFALGALIGPAVAGLATERFGLSAVFFATAVIGGSIVLLAPRREIHSMAR